MSRSRNKVIWTFFLKQNITRQWNETKITAEEQDQAAVNFLAILLLFKRDLSDWTMHFVMDVFD